MRIQSSIDNQPLHINRRAAILALHIFHDVVNMPDGRLATVEDGDNMWMGEANERRDLAIKTSDKTWVFQQRR